MENKPPVMLKIARLAFAAWLLVEFLSWLKILPLTLEFTWLGLMLTASIVWLALEIISWRLKKTGARYLWGLTYLVSLFSVCIDAFGDIARFYGTYAWYDQVAHFIGGAAVALVIFDMLVSLQQANKINLPLKGRGAITIGLAMALGSVYELEEYLEDVFFASHRLGDAIDTANDMLLNTIGAVIIIVTLVIIRRRKKFQ